MTCRGWYAVKQNSKIESIPGLTWPSSKRNIIVYLSRELELNIMIGLFCTHFKPCATSWIIANKIKFYITERFNKRSKMDWVSQGHAMKTKLNSNSISFDYKED